MNLNGRKSLMDFDDLFIRPAQVQIDITNKCNLNCLYCYNKHNNLKEKELTDEELKKVNKKIINQLNPLYVSFSGGEPLLRPNILLEMAADLKKNNIQVHLNTNLLLLTESIAASIGKINFDKINVNIDSLKNQDKIRGGKNLLSKLFNSLKILEKYVNKKKISIACVVNKLNYNEVMDIATFVKDNGYMELHLLDMIPSNDFEKKYILSRDEWLLFKEYFKQIEKMGIKVKLNHGLIFLSNSEKIIKIPFCMAGRFKLVICADGKIVPCNYFKSNDFVCGNALTDNLLRVWQDSDIMKKFRYFIPEDKKCQQCNLLNLCTGGCRALADKLLGNPFRGDPYCLIYNLR